MANFVAHAFDNIAASFAAACAIVEQRIFDL